MSLHTSTAELVYGQSDAEARRHFNNPSAQLVGETLSVGTLNRRVRGPRFGGVYAFHGAMTSAGGAGSVLNIGYSLLPDPDPTNNGHWVDSGITPIVLTSTTPFLTITPSRVVEWIRYQIVIGTSPGAGWLYHAAEGRETRS